MNNFQRTFFLTTATLVGLTGLAAKSDAAAITDPNLLSGKSVVASSVLWSFSAANAVDGTHVLHVFDDVPPLPARESQQILVHGFNSDIGEIRIWSDPYANDRIINSVTIRSSTNNNTALTDTFETELVATMAPTFNSNLASFLVSAPAGTQSLRFDFGTSGSSGSTAGVRVAELQAFPVPEPASIALLGLAIPVLLRLRKKS